MKIGINRNIIWCEFFVEQLVKLGVKNVCISPGSRSTPLIFAFAKNNRIKKYSIVDERSCGFFALGLSRSTNSPVAIVTTSGTAVAEIYPSIIEAYYQRIPLIICTADRPAYLRNRGSNQTINQFNIYKNHIKNFVEAGLPQISIKKIKWLKEKTKSSLNIATKTNIGPVHFNMAFEKPFEPNSFTDFVESKSIKKLFSVSSKNEKNKIIGNKKYSDKIDFNKNGLIFCGYGNYTKNEIDSIIKLSKKIQFPIIADGSSPFRFGGQAKEMVVTNFTTLIRSKKFVEKFEPEIVLQFGGVPTSTNLVEYLKSSTALKIIVNKFGDKIDPTLTAKKFIKCGIIEFCNSINNNKKNPGWAKNIMIVSNKAVNRGEKFLTKQPITFEGKIISTLKNVLPENSNLVVANSLPVRDLDMFASATKKRINIFTNRGASGIDGLNSTSLGVARGTNKPTTLLTGDLSFYHDLNGLYISKKENISLTVILVNNSGGGIFQYLPISGYKKIFTKYFLTPVNLDFKKIVEAYKGNYFLAKTEKQLISLHKKAISNKKLNVIEIKTNSKTSKVIRDNYLKDSQKYIDKLINEIKN